MDNIRFGQRESHRPVDITERLVETKVTVPQKEDERVIEVQNTSRTFRGRMQFLADEASYAQISESRIHDPHVDRVTIFSENGAKLLTLPVGQMLSLLDVCEEEKRIEELKKIYDWKQHLAVGWTGNFTPGGVRYLEHILGLPLTLVAKSRSIDP